MKEKAKKLLKNKYIIGSAIVTLLYVIYLIIANISPFGKNSILKTDLYQQYAEFLTYYKECLVNQKSIFFSWNMGLGNNFFTTFTYYLVSPFNLLVIFFKAENIFEFVKLITYLKLLLTANMTILYLDKAQKLDKKGTIIFSICYTFSAFTICYMLHIMWLDALYMLPIILLMVESYINNGKIHGVIISVAINMMFNYYLGFITAFFSGCYYIAKLVITTKFENKNIKIYIKKITKYILAMAIAFGISMIFFLPSFMQVKSTMETGKCEIINIDRNKIQLFVNTLFNNHNYMFEQEAGIIFSSTFVTIMCIFFFKNKKIHLKEKLSYSCLLIFMLLPIISPLLNKIWHGMTTPNCFNYRYSFCLIFLTIAMAAREYKEKEGINKKHFIINLVVYSILIAVEVALNVKQKLIIDNYKISYSSIVISYITYLAMLLILYLDLNTTKNIIKNLTPFVLVGLIIFDISISIKSYQTTNNDNYFTIENVKQYDNVLKEVLSQIECKETDRIIFKSNDVYTVNYSMKYGYSSIDYFTSARNKKTIRGMYQLGYNIQRDDALWLTSESGTSVNYLLAGVKYIVTREKLDGENKLFLYDYYKNIDDFNIYKLNVKQDFANYLKENITEKESDNPFFVSEYGPLEYQNKILQNMFSKDEDYMYSLDSENKLLNVSKNVEKEESSYKIIYKLKPTIETDLYLYSDNNVELYKNNEKVFEDYANLWSRECGIKQIVHLEKNQEYEFYITVKSTIYEKENERIEIYALDNNKIKQAIIQNNESEQKNIDVQNTKILKNGIELQINAKNDGYLEMPISYDEGLRAIVNGKSKEVCKINQCFTGIKIEKGISNIKITFIPRYFKLGSLITITSILCLIIVIIVENKRKKIYNIKN